MNEFVRFIEQRDFEEGLALRLQVGSVAVGDVCKIRSEDIDTRLKERPLRFAEATISIVAKREENGFIRLDYEYEAIKAEGSDSFDTDLFNEQSIAFDRTNGINLRTYLSDQPDSRWDDSMRQLIDLGSTSSVR
jgi:hypothetical protein